MGSNELKEQEVKVLAAIAYFDATGDATKERIVDFLRISRIPFALALRRLIQKSLIDGREDPIYVTDKGWLLIEDNLPEFLGHIQAEGSSDSSDET